MQTPILDSKNRAQLVQRFGRQVRFDIPLSKVSRWKIGGVADVVVTPRNVEELACLRKWIHEKSLPSVVIGATSNLLFADEGLRAIVIHIGAPLSDYAIDGCHVVAQTGIWVPKLARKAMLAGLGGLEHTCGIPGTLGGLIYMNGGSQRKGIGNNITYVKSVDERGGVIVREAHECHFSYRGSVFQTLNEIVVEVSLRLDRLRTKNNIRSDMLNIMRSRRKKFPQKLANCGSVFKSNPAMYEAFGAPGSLIEKFGLKGMSIGGASVSQHHANFIINTGGATASDVLRLIERMSLVVFKETGYRMDVEALYVSSMGEIMPADKAFPYIRV